MQYFLTPHHEDRPFFAYWEGAFNDQQIDWIREKAKSNSAPAHVGAGGPGFVNPEIRRSYINWMEYNNESAWVYERLGFIVSTLNSQYFRFDLTGFGEPFQLTNYDEAYEGMYGLHIDLSNNTATASRKLSLVLQLSDPVDYEGGILQMMPVGQQVTKVKKQKGLVVVFPSYVLHEVTPTTKGSRQTLVSWISGPPFK